MDENGFPESQEEFKRFVTEFAESEGVTFLTALYLFLEELIKDQLKLDGIELACHKGCSFCCMQTTFCTKLEWQEIQDFLNKHPALRKKIFKKTSSWAKYAKKHPDNNSQETVAMDWLGKPCIFLENGSCSIYPVRPIVCRTLTSKKVCTSVATSEAKKFRWEFLEWANDLTYLASKEKLGTKDFLPLPERVCDLKRKNRNRTRYLE